MFLQQCLSGRTLTILLIALAGSPAIASDPLHASKEWTPDQAGHLLRRAGFGGTPEQIEYLTSLGREKAVAYLVDFEKVPFDPIPIKIDPIYETGRRQFAGMDREEIQKIQAERRRADQLQLQRMALWWIETMVATPRPLEEKMVLFWHGHFTSGHREVKSSRALYIQNELFRKHATGNFKTLVNAVTRDPAMILYLNTQQNVKGKPNENYARELMELFTLGVGNYTETDIKEAARALTGIKVRPESGTSFVAQRQHDAGKKTIFKKTGNFDADDVVNIVLDQPAASRHIVKRLWTFFAHEDPSPEIIESLAKVLRDNKFELKPVLKAMFAADAFYADRARFTHIKSPVELMVGTARMLDVPAADLLALERGLRGMGQQLFQPPNVKGWDGGEAWITTSTLYNRYNAPALLVFGTNDREYQQQRRRLNRLMEETVGREGMMMAGDELTTTQPPYDPMTAVKSAKLSTPEAVVDYSIRRLLQRPISSERRAVLIESLTSELKKTSVTDAAAAPAIRGLIHLIVSMPEYQLS